MDIDFSTYAQLAGLAYMPTPEKFYPEMRGGGMQQQNQQKHCSDFDLRSSRTNAYQPPSLPGYAPYYSPGRGMENMSDGFQVNPYNPGRQCTSASEYRCRAKEQKRAKEMRSRNGLYSPFEAPVRYCDGDSHDYPNYADAGGRKIVQQNRNPFW